MGSQARRRDTDSSMVGRGPISQTRRVRTFMSRQSSPPRDESSLKQESYPAYRLSWKTLEAYLEKRYPGRKFQEVVSTSLDCAHLPMRSPANSVKLAAHTVLILRLRS